MGFVTPEEVWMKGEGRSWFEAGIEKTCKQFNGHIVDAAKVKVYVSEIMNGKRQFDPVPWRVLCFGNWFENR